MTIKTIVSITVDPEPTKPTVTYPFLWKSPGTRNVYLRCEKDNSHPDLLMSLGDGASCSQRVGVVTFAAFSQAEAWGYRLPDNAVVGISNDTAD